TVYGYLRGRTIAPAEGRLADWPAYDPAGFYGLDPDRLLLLEPGAPRAGVPHLGRLPEDVILRGFRCTDRFLLADLGLREHSLDLLGRVAEATVGITVEGVDQPLGSQAQFSPGRATVGGDTKPGLAVHPPWAPEPGVIGAVYAEWEVPVPEANSRLEFSVGLRDGAEQTDGVTFLVHADGREVFRQDWKRCEWQPGRVDLAEFAGRTVKLRLAVDKGPEGRGGYAWAAWSEPRVSWDVGALDFALEAFAPGQIPDALQPTGCTRLGNEAGLTHYRVPATASGQVRLLFDQPAPASLPLDLRRTPFSWTPLVGGVPLGDTARPAYLGASSGVGVAAGIEKPALAVHPPIDGVTTVDYVLTLPGTPGELSTAVAIQDGAKGNGIDFAVALDGAVLQHLGVEGPDGWHPLTLDLAPWAGRTILLSLLVDARGDATCDWARWAEPVIRAK
ncbi:MAG: hypothetical protein FJX74_06090, partial [Armatimonadetes bacterium]|nr:hypothetical protein [Armatimonadota bacterium]